VASPPTPVFGAFRPLFGECFGESSAQPLSKKLAEKSDLGYTGERVAVPPTCDSLRRQPPLYTWLSESVGRPRGLRRRG
jgi:hypothetical protein